MITQRKLQKVEHIFISAPKCPGTVEGGESQLSPSKYSHMAKCMNSLPGYGTYKQFGEKLDNSKTIIIDSDSSSECPEMIKGIENALVPEMTL